MLEMDGFWFVELKPSGPVHVYVPPATVATERFSVWPGQIGVLLVGCGAVTVTETQLANDVQPLLVTATQYCPAKHGCMLVIDGFWLVELKPLGPVHSYVVPATVATDKFNVPPSAIGLLALGTGAEGVTVIEPELEQSKLLLAATLRVTGHAEADVNASIGKLWPVVSVAPVSDQVYVVGRNLNTVPEPPTPAEKVVPYK
jgi:hypothetical protein